VFDGCFIRGKPTQIYILLQHIKYRIKSASGLSTFPKKGKLSFYAYSYGQEI
jgi:hypothetical protein